MASCWPIFNRPPAPEQHPRRRIENRRRMHSCPPAVTIVFVVMMNRFALALALALSSTHLVADDWPEWRGRGRLGVWKETGVLDEFPKEGLAIKWRSPVHSGF